MTADLFLFDDASAQGWDPFLITRPAGELHFGALLLRERAEAFFRLPCSGHLSKGELFGFVEPGAPPVVDPSLLSAERTRVVLTSRAVPRGLAPPPTGRRTTLTMGGSVVGWILEPGDPLPDPGMLLVPEPLEDSAEHQLEGRLLSHPWELMSKNGAQLREDIPILFGAQRSTPLEGVSILGTGILSVGDEVRFEPGVVLDLRDGPIRLSDGVEVRSHTRLAGPAYVGAGSTLLGGVISDVSIGPVCKIRGEVETSVVLGFSNKAHDGFLGHSYLGRWVNLGAFTTNSDLKNNYGPVRVGGRNGPLETGILKAGCFLGDHVKTGIGTLFNTGTVVGAGSNLFGGEMPPTYVPPFSWGSGHNLSEYRIDEFLETGARAMARRDMELDESTRDLFRRAFAATAAQRTRKE